MRNSKANKEDLPSTINLDRERGRIRTMKILFAVFSIILLVSLALSLLLSH